MLRSHVPNAVTALDAASPSCSHGRHGFCRPGELLRTPAVSALRVAATLLVATTFTSFAAATNTYGIFKSIDGGQSWIRSDAGMPGRSRINAFGTAGVVLFAGTDAGIFRSRDEAGSWQSAKGAGLSAVRILSFASMGGKVFAGTDGQGMLVSQDEGESWVFNATFTPRKVRCLLARHDHLYAGTDAEGVFLSRDGGQTWIGLMERFPNDGQVFALAQLDGVVFAGLYGRGLYAWDEQKGSWSKRGGITPLALASLGGTLLAGQNPGGLSWSEDFGVTWSKGMARIPTDSPLTSMLAEETGELSAEAPIWEMASNNSVVFAGAASGIYYSIDLGRHWTRARRGLPEESPGIAFLAEQEFVLAAIPIKTNKGEPDSAMNRGRPVGSEKK